MAEEQTRPLGIVVPTLNAAHALGATLDALEPGRHLIREIVIADGGSDDATRAVAAARGARVVAAPRGRGAQLAAGAAAVAGDWLLFLHADTVLAPGWVADAVRFIDMSGGDGRGSDGRAGAFRFALDDDRWAARLMARGVAWRSRALGLPYGDQGLLISRRFYGALGGFRPLPIMEDVEIARRIGRARLTLLDSQAVTSAARYRKAGYAPRIARNLLCLALYFLGVPPSRIAGLYGRAAPAEPVAAATNHLIIFARAPRFGAVKSRLAADIGKWRAWRFYRAVSGGIARRLGADRRWDTTLAITPDRAVRRRFHFPAGLPRRPQGDGGLGARMARFLNVPEGEKAVIIGSDIPDIAPGHIADAFAALEEAEFVFGPAEDGGYWLVGVRGGCDLAHLFDGVRFSTAHALADTRTNVPAGARVAEIARLADIDDGAGYARWRARRKKGEKGGTRLFL